MQKKAFLEHISGEDGAVIIKLVILQHNPLGVTLQQDMRALHQRISLLGHSEHSCSYGSFIIIAMVTIDHSHRQLNLVQVHPDLPHVILQNPDIHHCRGDEGHGEQAIDLKQLVALDLNPPIILLPARRRHPPECLGDCVEHHYIAVVLASLRTPVQAFLDDDGRHFVGRRYPTGQHKANGLRVGRAADVPRWLIRDEQGEDPVPAIGVLKPRVVQHPVLPSFQRAARVEADDVVVEMERREARPVARAGVAGVEPDVVGEEEDAVAGALDPEHAGISDGERGVDVGEADDRRGRSGAEVDGPEVDADEVGVFERVEGHGLVVEAVEEERHGLPVVVAVVVAAEVVRAGEIAPLPADGAAAGDLGGRHAEEQLVEGGFGDAPHGGSVGTPVPHGRVRRRHGQRGVPSVLRHGLCGDPSVRRHGRGVVPSVRLVVPSVLRHGRRVGWCRGDR